MTVCSEEPVMYLVPIERNTVSAPYRSSTRTETSGIDSRATSAWIVVLVLTARERSLLPRMRSSPFVCQGLGRYRRRGPHLLSTGYGQVMQIRSAQGQRLLPLGHHQARPLLDPLGQQPPVTELPGRLEAQPDQRRRLVGGHQVG